ncbi:MAG TPA: hydrogenase maturation nickel metallochaperone HypA [Streptosporangiaceae bacterium]|jgi:hydrogenase nickel incorporation protein HypA/HybF
MHELSLTQEIVEAIADRMGDAEIECVRLEIGKLSGVVVESIRFCFDLVAEGTIVAGARLEIDEPSGHARCRECASEFDIDDPIVLCPTCATANVDVLSGRDMRIRSVEVRTACAPPAAARTTPGSG